VKRSRSHKQFFLDEVFKSHPAREFSRFLYAGSAPDFGANGEASQKQGENRPRPNRSLNQAGWVSSALLGRRPREIPVGRLQHDLFHRRLNESNNLRRTKVFESRWGHQQNRGRPLLLSDSAIYRRRRSSCCHSCPRGARPTSLTPRRSVLP
jgi:hypothetical protein